MKLKLQWLLASAMLLLISSCDKDDYNHHSHNIEKEFHINGASKIYAINGFNITITKGSEYSFKAKGAADLVNDIKLNQQNGIVNIEFEHNWSNRPFIDINITLPDLTQLNLDAAGTATINGFANENHVIRTILNGASKCTLNGAPINVAVDISDASQLDITGNTLSIYGALSFGGKLNAYNLTATEVDIEASIGSEAHVKVVDRLFAFATTGSKIYYKGDPAVKSIETTEGGQVIKE